MSQDEETVVAVKKPRRAAPKRVATVVSETEVTVPKKRVTRTQTETTPRRTTRRKVQEADVPLRKAPTPLTTEKVRAHKSRKQRVVVAGLILVGIISSAVVGFTDKGPINVEATITARNEQSRAAGREGEIVPVQNTDIQPDGGLIGLVGSDSAPPAVEVVATTTDAVASSSAPVGNIPLTEAEVEAAAQAPTEESTQ